MMQAVTMKQGVKCKTHFSDAYDTGKVRRRQSTRQKTPSNP